MSYLDMLTFNVDMLAFNVDESCAERIIASGGVAV